MMTLGYNQTAADFANADSEDGGISIFAIVMLGCLSIATAICFLTPFYLVFRNRRRGHARRPSLRPQHSEDEKKTLRYSEIESWLVNKTVHEHDALCEQVVRPPGKRGRTCTEETCDDVCSDVSSEGARECPICMEEMVVGSIVSWSANPKCEHVFHHRCIKQWLLTKQDCPFCRECFLPVDSIPRAGSMKQIADLIVAQNYRRAHCYYCIRDGIVTVDKHTLLDSKEERAQLHARETETPGRLELIQLRHDDIEKGLDATPAQSSDDESDDIESQ